MASLGATVRYTPPATSGIANLIAALNSGAQKKVVGVAAVRALKDHLVHREQTDPHRSATALGAPPTGLYADMAQSTSYNITGPGLDITISHNAARQRIEGGEIKPGPGKQYLTIPARREAYGRRAATVGIPLKFGFAPDPAHNNTLRRALVAASGSGKKKANQRQARQDNGAYFWLVRAVEQDGDDTILPTDDQFFSAVFDALDGWIQELT